jgi:hypothetical protein
VKRWDTHGQHCLPIVSTAYYNYQVNVVLKDLWLNNSSIGDEGAVALGEALCANASLTSINLYRNKISQEGAGALASALKVKSKYGRVSRVSSATTVSEIAFIRATRLARHALRAIRLARQCD